MAISPQEMKAFELKMRLMREVFDIYERHGGMGGENPCIYYSHKNDAIFLQVKNKNRNFVCFRLDQPPPESILDETVYTSAVAEMFFTFCDEAAKTGDVYAKWSADNSVDKSNNMEKQSKHKPK